MPIESGSQLRWVPTRGLVLFLLATALFGSVTVTPVHAQATPADSAAVLLHAAEQFQLDGRPDVAEALLRYLIERFPGSPSAAAARRTLVDLVQVEEAGDGRVELQVWGATYGLWLGIAIPAALGADGSEAFGVGLLLGGPGGFLLGSQLARSRSLSTGQARAITLGGTWGTWQGWGWSEVADWGVNEICDIDYCYEDDEGRRRFLAAVLGGVAGIGVGSVLSRRAITPGQATTVNLGALWGTWFGLASGVLADSEGDALLAWTLLGGNAGLLGAALGYPRWNFTRSRARLISIAGVIGGLAGAGVDLLVQPDGDKALIGIPLAASVIGLAIGATTTRDKAPGDAGGADLGSLIQLDQGRWGLGTPLPVPVRWEAIVDGREVRSAQARFTLFRARF